MSNNRPDMMLLLAQLGIFAAVGFTAISVSVPSTLHYVAFTIAAACIVGAIAQYFYRWHRANR